MKIRFDTPPSSPQVTNDLAVRYAAAKRNIPRLRWFLLVLLVFALPTYYGLRFASELLWVNAPGFIMMEQVGVKAGTTGRVLSFLPAGSVVQVGSPIITLAPPDKPIVAPALAPRNGVNSRQIHSVRAALRLSEQELALRQHKVDVMGRLVSQGAATAADLASAQEQWLGSSAQLIRLRADLETQLEPRHPEQAEAAPAALSSPPPAAPAPFAGQIIQQYAHHSEWVDRDTDIAVIRSQRKSWIRAYLNPAEMRYARLGMRAILVFEDGGRIPATVTRIGREAQKLPPDRVSPLEARNQSIVVDLQSLADLPDRYDIYYLPLNVRFEFSMAPIF